MRLDDLRDDLAKGGPLPEFVFATADSYMEGREAILAQVPEGWELLTALPVR